MPPECPGVPAAAVPVRRAAAPLLAGVVLLGVQVGCGGGGAGTCDTSRDCASGELCVLGACGPRNGTASDGGGFDGTTGRDASADAHAVSDAVPREAGGDPDAAGGLDAGPLPDGPSGGRMEFGPGTYELELPTCSVLEVRLWGGGGGGGGGGADAAEGQPGGTTRLGETLVAGGGGGAPAGGSDGSSEGGAGGIVEGGDISSPGDPGGEGGQRPMSGAGGDTPNGGEGGEPVGWASPGDSGDLPGGGGSGAGGLGIAAAGGGSGAYLLAYLTEMPEPVLEVGQGGGGGPGQFQGGDGADGRAEIRCVGEAN